jgi:hypothetical protein
MTAMSSLLVERGDGEDVDADARAAVGRLLDEEHCGGAMPRVDPEPRGLCASVKSADNAIDLKRRLSATPTTPSHVCHRRQRHR